MAASLQIFSRTRLLYPALGFFMGAFLGAITGLFVAPLFTFLIAAVLGTALIIYGRWHYGAKSYPKAVNFIGSHIITTKYQLQKKLPMGFRRFLHYCTGALLLKQSMGEFEFIHRRIRDYFAIRQYLPLLENTSVTDRATAIIQISKLKDASCDVLLEMIDDNDKSIRMECLAGLGEIGTATAAKSLLEAIKKTSGELKASAINQLRKINDMAATPVLLQALNDYPVNDEVFKASLYALIENLARLSSWENVEKMKEYLNSGSPLYANNINHLLSNIATSREKSKLELILETLHHKNGGFLKERHNSIIELAGLNDLELRDYLSHKVTFARIAFQILIQRNPGMAVQGMLDNDNLTRNFIEIINPNRASIKKINVVLRQLILANDKRYLLPALTFMAGYPNTNWESTILLAIEGDDTLLKQAGLSALDEIATKKSIPFLLSCLQEDSLTQLTSKILAQFPRSTLVTLIKEESNAGVCHKIIPLLAKSITRKTIVFLIEQLHRDTPSIKNAAIKALGHRKAGQAKPILWQLFNQGDISYMEALIGSLSVLGEINIIAELPRLFLQNQHLQATILSALIRLKAHKEIQEIYDYCIQTGFDSSDNTDKLQYHFAAYFAVIGKFEIVVELTFHHLSTWFDAYLKKTQVPGSKDIRSASLFTEILAIKASANGSTLGFGGEKDTESYRRSFLETGILNNLSRNVIFYISDIYEESRFILDTIYLYDIGLAKDLTLEHFTDNQRNLKKTLAQKLTTTTNTDHKRLLIAIIGGFNLSQNESMLRPYLSGHEDELTAMAIQVLGHLKDVPSLDEFIAHLRSSNKELAALALTAIGNLCKKTKLLEKKLLLHIYQIDNLQILLTDPQYSIVLSQLSFDEIIGMSADNNANFRYLAAIYISILGYGKALTRLNILLEDNAPISIQTNQNHKTVSEGALSALDRIGTPSAKALVDKWYQRQGLQRS